LDAKNAAFGAVPAVQSISGINTLSGPIQLFVGGSYWRVEVDSGKLNVTGPVINSSSGSHALDFIGAGDGEWFSGITEGPTTSVYMDGTGTWTLSGTNTYSGLTQVASGRLIVNGQIRSLSALTVNFGATLGGTGIISSPVEILAQGTLSPGASIGTLTVSNNLSLDAGSTNVFEVNGDTLAHDMVTGVTSLTYGGNLVISLSGSGTALVNGAALKLFDAQSYTGSFDTITPAIPSAGHTWNTETLATDGTLRIGPLPPNITSITAAGGGNWQLSGTGEEGFGYRVLAATNLTLPLGSWWVLGSGTISGGTYSFTDTTATNEQRFYRVVTP
jgi:autotransporter-associated beta strand protein